jgi:ribonucleotide monophosphatase NagD (HAD superfamily)
MRFVTATLRGSARPLVEVYDSALLDLDGVVYVGPDPVPGVSAALSEARARGIKLAFVTNNASRTPEAVARRLVDLGVEARADEVITSAQAAARYLA